MTEKPHIIWNDAVSWGIAELKGKSLKVSFCKLALGAVVYNIRTLRNDLKHGNAVMYEKHILKKIDREIINRIRGVGKFKESVPNASLCCKWGF